MRPRGPIDKGDVVANAIMQLPNERVWLGQRGPNANRRLEYATLAAHSPIEYLQSLSKRRPELTNGQRGHDSNWLMATN